MKIIKITHQNIDNLAILAVKALKALKLVVLPTDTVYGLVGVYDNETVRNKIFQLKNRPIKKALPVFVKDIAMAQELADIPGSKVEFLKKIWPGQVTVIFCQNENNRNNLNQKTIALRVPNNNLVLNIIDKLGLPLIETAANLSDQPTGQTVGDIKKYFEKSKNTPHLVVDGGELDSISSTVVDFTGSKPVVVRQGLMDQKKINKIYNQTKK